MKATELQQLADQMHSNYKKDMEGFKQTLEDYKKNFEAVDQRLTKVSESVVRIEEQITTLFKILDKFPCEKDRERIANLEIKSGVIEEKIKGSNGILEEKIKPSSVFVEKITFLIIGGFMGIVITIINFFITSGR